MESRKPADGVERSDPTELDDEVEAHGIEDDDEAVAAMTLSACTMDHIGM